MAPLLIQNKSQSPYNAYKTLCDLPSPPLPTIILVHPLNPHPNYPFPAMKTFLLFLKLTWHTLTLRSLHFAALFVLEHSPLILSYL